MWRMGKIPICSEFFVGTQCNSCFNNLNSSRPIIFFPYSGKLTVLFCAINEIETSISEKSSLHPQSDLHVKQCHSGIPRTEHGLQSSVPHTCTLDSHTISNSNEDESKYLHADISNRELVSKEKTKSATNEKNNIDERGKINLHELDSSSPTQLLNRLTHGLQLTSTEGCGDAVVVDIPDTPPLTRAQYNMCMQYWPSSFHEDKE